MKKYYTQFFVLAVILFSACNTSHDEKKDQRNANTNPPAVGFNLEESDSAAIAIADQVMEAQGGRKAWDTLGTISWTFFGNRDLVWNKQTGDVRIQSKRDSMLYLLNLNTMDGRVAKNGIEITDTTKTEWLNRAKSIWINDGYWLFMPFKLKDSGVTLTYVGEGETEKSQKSDLLELTFQNVGVTPDNKYRVWVDKSDKLIKQWAFYRNAEQDTANFIRSWDNYQQYGSLKLSADRVGGGPGNVKILDNIPNGLFSELKPISY